MYPSNLMFVPKCIPIAEWPERHHAAWQLGFNKGGLFAVKSENCCKFA